MSNTITVTVELGPESQAKLDKILEALQGVRPNCHSCVESAVQMAKNMTIEEAVTQPASALEIVEPENPAAEHPADEVSPHGEPEPAAEPEQPQYTKDDVLRLVQKLAAPGSSKREQAKDIVKSYGAKVSDIPAEKYAEVMSKLNALEG